MAAGAMAAVALGSVFAMHELRHPDPVVQPRLFQRRAFVAASGGIGLGTLAMYTLLVSVPILLVARQELSALGIGMVLATLSASMIVLAPLGGHLADRYGRRLPTVSGLAVVAIGSLPIAIGGVEIEMPALLAGLLLVGSGLALATPGLQATSVESVDPANAGAAAGAYATSRYVGSILGSAIMAGLLGADRGDIAGLGFVFFVVLISGILATAVSLGLRPRPQLHAGV